MTPNQLIKELQKLIESAQAQGYDIGDAEDAIMFDTKPIRTVAEDTRARYVPLDVAELEFPDGRRMGPSIVLK